MRLDKSKEIICIFSWLLPITCLTTIYLTCHAIGGDNMITNKDKLRLCNLFILNLFSNQKAQFYATFSFNIFCRKNMKSADVIMQNVFKLIDLLYILENIKGNSNNTFRVSNRISGR